MGWGFGIECNSCDYEEIITLGVGMICPCFEHLMQILPAQSRGRILRLLEDRPEPLDAMFSNELFFCPNCRCFKSRLDYTIIFPDDLPSITPPGFRCGYCRKKLEKCPEEKAEELRERIGVYPCPKCHGLHLKIESEMMWD